VSRRHSWHLIKMGQLTATTNPLDRRSKRIAVGALSELQCFQGRRDRPRPWSVAAYNGPVAVHRDAVDDFPRERWKHE
jgi:hypothetical protein